MDTPELKPYRKISASELWAKCLLGGCAGSILTVVACFAGFDYWVEHVYNPAILAAGDDGGSSEGWVLIGLISRLPIFMLVGGVVGAVLIHPLWHWFKKRADSHASAKK